MAWEWDIVGVNKLIFTLFLLISIRSYAQTESVDQPIHVEEVITESVELNEEMNIHFMNKLSIEDFLNDVELSSFIINEKQRNALKQHLLNTGSLVDLLELQSLAEFDYSTYTALLKMIKIQQSNTIKTKQFLKIQQRSIRQNYLDEKTLGSRWGMYQQIQLQLKQGTNIGWAREFDVGENTSNSLLNKYDHYAWYINHKTRNMEINVGNFQIYYGLGMLLGQGFSGAFGQGGINNIIQNRWKGIANQIEYNTFSGAYVIKRINNFNIGFGISRQSIDSVNTFGIHRLESQLKSKNAASEKVSISAIDYTRRKYKSSLLLLRNHISKKSALSLSNQLFLGSSTLFSELILQSKKLVYTVGLSRLINKNLQLSLSFTSFNDTYKGEYAATAIQGITNSNKHGFIVHVNYQTANKWVINFTHKATFKELNYEKSLGTSADHSENIRLDRNFRNKIKMNLVLFTKMKEQEGDKQKEFTVRMREYRTRTGIGYTINEKFYHDIFYYRSIVNTIHSSAITYQIIYKSSWLKCSYLLSLQEINNSVPLYISSTSLIQGRNTQAVFENGSLQQWALSVKINRINIQLQLTQLNKVKSEEEQRKLMLSLKYP